MHWGFPGGLDGKESACNAGELSSIPGSGRALVEGNGNPLQYSCLENSIDRGAWRATVHGVTKNQTQLSDKHLNVPAWKQRWCRRYSRNRFHSHGRHDFNPQFSSRPGFRAAASPSRHLSHSPLPTGTIKIDRPPLCLPGSHWSSGNRCAELLSGSWVLQHSRQGHPTFSVVLAV